MNRRNILITGANGAIGRALCATFKNAGCRVIASDQAESSESVYDEYIAVDLNRLCSKSVYRDKAFTLLRKQLNDNGLHALINNAAIQIVSPAEQLTVDDWHNTMDVNLIAPFLLTKAFLPDLEKANGSVINIGSIHAQLTKPHFTAYATSKAALVGMTRSLAVELGSRVRINAICPAAIATPMLEAGFKDDPQGLHQLASYHPSGCIGTLDDVTKAALYLADATGRFLNGAILGLDGGISSRLHDPA